jgi:hypothetical protein
MEVEYVRRNVMSIIKRWIVVSVASVLFLVAVTGGVWWRGEVAKKEAWDHRAQVRDLPADDYKKIIDRIDQVAASGEFKESDMALAKQFSASDKPEFRSYALTLFNTGLKKSDPEAVVDFVTPFLEDESEKVRSTAYMIVGMRDKAGWRKYESMMKADSSESVKSLIPMFESDDNEK